MSKNNNKGIVLFENSKIRRECFNERWYYSIVDIVAILTGQSEHNKAKSYWTTLKSRLKDEGSQVVTKCDHLKMMASDGKYYVTDVADNETILRLIQSIPSPKTEPFKLWLAQLGKERIDEIQDPELAVTRAKEIYTRKGYPKSWIDKRLRGINVRNTLTDEWRERGVKAQNEFAILTDEIYKDAFEMNAKEYKGFKSLDKENNLRDHMNDMELILTMLGEATTTELTKARDSQELPRLKVDAADGGAVAGRTRKDIETQTGKKVLSKKNFLDERISDELPVSKTRIEVNPRAHTYVG
jgi:hypothetical protein